MERGGEHHPLNEDSTPTSRPARSGGPAQSCWDLGAPRTGPQQDDVAVVAGLVGALGPPGLLDDVALGERVIDLMRLRSLLEAALCEHVREWDSRCLWASDGSKAPGPRLARSANCSPVAAAAIVKLGRALAAMPVTTNALHAGLISLDHARRLARANNAERAKEFTTQEAHLVALAVEFAGDWNSFDRLVTYWEHACDDFLCDPNDPDTKPAREQRQHQRRNLHLSNTRDGWDLSATLTPSAGRSCPTN